MGRTLAYLHLAIGLLLQFGVPRYAYAQAASAGDVRSVVVIIDGGNTDLLVESLVRSTAEAELRKRGFTIVENAEVGGDIPKRLLACAGNPECSVATLSGIEARFVIFISLRPDEEGKSNNFKIVARNYEVATGIASARTMRRCSECKEDVDLAAFSEGVIVDLIRDPKPAQAKPVDRASEPAVTPELSVDTTTATQPLAGDPSTQEKDDGSSLTGGLKYASLVGGVAGLATGTVLVLVDGPVIRDGLRQSEERDTLTIGYASLGAGAVLLGLSAWLWSRDYDQNSSHHASLVPVVNPDARAGSFVWTGTF